MNQLTSFDQIQAVASTTKIISVGTFLPEQVVKSDDLLTEIKSYEQFGIPINLVSRFMGIVERRMSDWDAKPSDLAIPAAKEAIDTSGINPDEIDLVVFCGIERDQPEPATAHTIQNKLGLNAQYAFDVSNACIGFVDGIQIANKFINSGSTRYALVVTGEISTHVLRSVVDELKSGGVTRERALDCIGSLTVGDAGGAIILGPADPFENEGFQFFSNTVDSSHIDKCIYRRTPNGIEGQMKMTEILDQCIEMHSVKVSNTLEKLVWPEFDWLISHQTGYKNFKAFSDFDGINPETMIKTYTNLGNVTTATFALSWKKLSSNGKVKKGDRIGGLFSGSGMTISQFGIYY